jgi:hypothetical protein
MEKEILGLYVAGHPLDGYGRIISGLANCDTRDFRQAGENRADMYGSGANPADVYGSGGVPAGGYDSAELTTGDDNAGETLAGEQPAVDPSMDGSGKKLNDGQYAVIGGIISKVKTKYTKSNALMAFVDLEDMYGAVEMLVFPKVYERLDKKISPERVILAKGKISAREDEDAKFLCDDVAWLSLPADRGDEALPSDYYAGLKKWAGSGFFGYGRRDNAPYAAAGAPAGGGNGGGGGVELSDGGYGGSAPANGQTPRQVRTDEPEQALYIRVNGEEPKPLLDSAYATLRYFSGNTPVFLYNREKKARKDLGRDYSVRLSETLLEELRERFGADNVATR